MTQKMVILKILLGIQEEEKDCCLGFFDALYTKLWLQRNCIDLVLSERVNKALFGHPCYAAEHCVIMVLHTPYIYSISSRNLRDYDDKHMFINVISLMLQHEMSRVKVGYQV